MARKAGVSVIYQDFSLAGTLTVAENLFLGQELRVGPFVRRRTQQAQARTLLHSLTTDIAPTDVVENLSRASQQIVEIAKALRTDPRLLILDEPTAALTEAEVRLLLRSLRQLKQHNVPILYVTHRLGEVFEIADRVSVLRDGAVVLSQPVSETSRDDLVTAIVGAAPATARHQIPGAHTPRARPLLAAHELVAPGIGPIDLELHGGEIVGVFGLLGSGRTELVEALFGARQRSSGTLYLNGAEVRCRRPTDAIAAGILLVPSDRLRKSLFSPLTTLDNVLLPAFRDLSVMGARRRDRERAVFAETAGYLTLRPARPDVTASHLSGGNQQKLVIGRWLRPNQPMKVLLLDEPTEGVDAGTRADLYRVLRELVQDPDRGVIMTSSDTSELVAVVDRALVLAHGRIVGELAGPALNERKLLELVHLHEGNHDDAIA
jgi:ribose transport system ATP-binding protein